MLKKLGTILLAISIGTLLSSCLVEKDKIVDKISRTTDSLRIYQAGDYIDYNVTAIIDTATSTTTQYGTLRISWENTADLTDPILGGFISPDLKETTTLTYDGSSEPDAIAARYISQVKTAPGLGSIILHAIDDEVDVDYWPYPNSSTPPTTAVITPVIFESPLSIGTNSPYEFSVMECSSNLCDTPIYTFTEDTFNIVGDTREVTTNIGIFSDPFEVSFLGGTTPEAGASAVSFLGDIRDACGSSTDYLTHTGNMFVVPEIGMIKMTNLCRNNTSGTSVRYIITVRNTSFPF